MPKINDFLKTPMLFFYLEKQGILRFYAPMFVDFYIHKEEKQLGPFSKREIFDQILSGKISEEDYCWTEGLKEWVPLKSLELTNPSTWTKEEANHVPASISQRMRKAQDEALKKKGKKYSLPVRILSFLMGLLVLSAICISLFVRYQKPLEKAGFTFSFKKTEWKHRESFHLLIYTPAPLTPVTHETLDVQLLSPFKTLKKEIYGSEHNGLTISVSKFTSPDIIWEGSKKEILIDAIYNGAFSIDPTVPPLRKLWNETKTIEGHEVHSYRYDTEDFKIVDLNVIFEEKALYFVIATHKPENQDAEFSKVSNTLQFKK
jgi:hypothetical protein